MATEYKLSYTGSEINEKLNKIDSLAAKSELPTKLSELTDDKGFATEFYVQEYAQPIGNYALKSEIPEIPDVPVRSVNDKTGAVTLSASDVGALPNTTVIPYKTSQLTNDSGFITSYTETDPTVPAWAKNATKPTYTASEVGALPSSTAIPSKLSDLTADTTHRTVTDTEKAAWNAKANASDIPTKVSQLTNDSGFITNSPVTSVNGRTGDIQLIAKDVNDALGYTPANVTDVFDSALQPTFTNIFDSVEIEYGKIIGLTDMTVGDTTANLATTGYIPVKAGDIIRVNEDFPIKNSGSPAYILYDANKTALKALRNDSIAEGAYYVSLVEADANGYITAFKINKPSASAFIRICNDSNLIGNNPVLTVNEEIGYEVGYGTLLNKDVRIDQSQILNAPVKNGWSILPHERLSIAYSSIGKKPINTVEHFTYAATNYGYNALKCDVRPTSDGELVCCHDAGFTFNSSGKITTYDSANSTVIHSVTAATVLGYSFPTGEHPCLVGDYLEVCRKYGKVAFITIRNEYMDVVIPKLLEELKIHNMTYSTIINCMTYDSLVQWRQQDKTVMINYTLNFGVAIDQAQIDRAIGLGYCSLSGFSLSSSSTDPSASCDFEYARANGIRLLEAIAYKEGSPEACYAMGYDGCMIGIPWGSPTGGGISEESVQNMIDSAIGDAIGGSY